MPYIHSKDPWSPDPGEVPWGDCPKCGGESYFGDVDADEDGKHVSVDLCGGRCKGCNKEICSADTDQRETCDECHETERLEGTATENEIGTAIIVRAALAEGDTLKLAAQLAAILAPYEIILGDITRDLPKARFTK